MLVGQFLCQSYLELLSQLRGDLIGHSQVDLRPEKSRVELQHFKVCLSNSKEVSIPNQLRFKENTSGGCVIAKRCKANVRHPRHLMHFLFFKH